MPRKSRHFPSAARKFSELEFRSVPFVLPLRLRHWTLLDPHRVSFLAPSRQVKPICHLRQFSDCGINDKLGIYDGLIDCQMSPTDWLLLAFLWNVRCQSSISGQLRAVRAWPDLLLIGRRQRLSFRLQSRLVLVLL